MLTFPFSDDTPVATAKNMPGDSADLFGDGVAEDGSTTNGRLWRTVIIGEQEHRIDLQMIKPYMRVVTHGGEGKGSRGVLNGPAGVSFKSLLLKLLGQLRLNNWLS